MSLMLTTAKVEAFDPAPPATPSASPYDAITQCVTPTYDGSGKTTHPSVVDMGRQWHGFRWWLVDTPYPMNNDDYENPSIWGSNDRVNWEVPPGLTNPIDLWPGGDPGRPATAFNSDPELVWDPEGQRLVVFWRDADSSLPAKIDMYAATSTDGSVWTHVGDPVLSVPVTEAFRSPAIARVSATDWRCWFLDDDTPSTMWRAGNPLGPWSKVGMMVANGAALMGWHGDFIYDPTARRYYALVGETVAGTGPFWPATSLDGLTWVKGASVFGAGYRSTMLPPRGGTVEVWYSRNLNLWYTRLPISAWPTAV